MRKLPYILTPLFLATATAFGREAATRGPGRLAELVTYDTDGPYQLGPKFVELQGSHFFSQTMGWVVGITLVIFLIHYLIIGPREFDRTGKRITVYTLFERTVHWIAALAFVLLVPTGMMILYGQYLGGGDPVRTARYIHDIATVLFAVSVVPMFFIWLIPMLPTWDDIKWFMIAGGYLSKKKREVPAGKFNAGQKMWFWIATLGGAVMIATGAAMYFQTFDLGIAKALEMNQTDLLRAAAIVHNVLAFAIVALFITHLYMSLFAIKGSLRSMINGTKREEEVKYLHHSWYRKLKKAGRV